MIFRKADLRRLGLTKGWEMVLSHDMKTSTTVGFCKGTAKSSLVSALRHYRASAVKKCHPVLLPFLMIREHMTSRADMKQREAWDTQGGIECAVADYGRLQKELEGVKSGGIDLDAINQGLDECHAQVMKHSRAAYIRAIEALEDMMKIFLNQFPALQINLTTDFHNTHVSLSSGLDFYKRRLHGIEGYANTTLRRLEIQRGLVSLQTKILDAANLPPQDHAHRATG